MIGIVKALAEKRLASPVRDEVERLQERDQVEARAGASRQQSVRDFLKAYNQLCEKFGLFHYVYGGGSLMIGDHFDEDADYNLQGERQR